MRVVDDDASDRAIYDDRNDGEANQKTALLREPFNVSLTLRPQSRFDLQGEEGEQRPGLNASQARIGGPAGRTKTSRRQAERGNGLAVHRKKSTDGGKLMMDKEKTENFLKVGLRMAYKAGVPSRLGRHTRTCLRYCLEDTEGTTTHRRRPSQPMAEALMVSTQSSTNYLYIVVCLGFVRYLASPFHRHPDFPLIVVNVHTS